MHTNMTYSINIHIFFQVVNKCWKISMTANICEYLLSSIIIHPLCVCVRVVMANYIPIQHCVITGDHSGYISGLYRYPYTPLDECHPIYGPVANQLIPHIECQCIFYTSHAYLNVNKYATCTDWQCNYIVALQSLFGSTYD